MTTGSRRARATRAIHSSTLKDAHGSPHLPLYTTTTFTFASTTDRIADLEQALA